MSTPLIPDGFAPEDDRNHEPPPDTPGWTESYAFWAYWHGQSLYVHFQRHPDDITMWRGLVTVLGEDGSVVASHGFGRELSSSGPGFSQCHAICEEPFARYRLRVDAMGQRSDRATLRRRILPSLGQDVTPLALDLAFVSVSATYSPMPAAARGHSNAKWTHYTPCRVTGEVTIGATTIQVDGPGFRDHSAGPRSFDHMGSGFMTTGIFPGGRSFMAIGVTTTLGDGSRTTMGVGGATIDGEVSYATRLGPPAEVSTVPKVRKKLGVLEIETGMGTARIGMRTTGQGAPFALLPPCHEAVGLPNGLRTPIFYHEWRMALDWDGERGVGSWQPCIRTG